LLHRTVVAPGQGFERLDHPGGNVSNGNGRHQR
jgi:hypothetical protein